MLLTPFILSLAENVTFRVAFQCLASSVDINLYFSVNCFNIKQPVNMLKAGSILQMKKKKDVSTKKDIF